MTIADPRQFPLIEVTPRQVSELLRPVLRGRAIGGVTLAAGGLTNTVYRIEPADGGPAFSLRIFAGGALAYHTELRVVTYVESRLPVPHILLAECGTRAFRYPYVVSQWIEGVTLNTFRRQQPPSAFLGLAAAMGRLLANVGSVDSQRVFSDQSPPPRADRAVDAVLASTETRLRHSPARTRLGEHLADALWRSLTAAVARFRAAPRTSLVHGDFGGRNILVGSDTGGMWRVTGLIDWEGAFSGWTLWDVGAFFRYARRYSTAYLEEFERGYAAAGGVLPADWWQTARLLDATRLVAILSAQRALPSVFTECRELVASIVRDGC